jgi:sugar/nucleoside kinase (ribokinase family)
MLPGVVSQSVGDVKPYTREEMNSYDILFMGHLATATIVRFQGPTFVERGGPAFFGPLAASCRNKRIATMTRVAKTEVELLEPLKSAGIHLFVQDQETTQLRVIHPNANVDERQVFLVKHGGYFSVDDIPPIEPCLIHLGGLSPQEFTLEMMRALKTRGFRLSLDMQSFLWHTDNHTGAIHLGDVPEIKEILGMVDFVKLDVTEGQALTGTDVLRDQAVILEDWGSPETVITCSDGALAQSEGKTYYTKFTNRNITGRTGRGDTFSGGYLAHRLDHSVEDSLKFAAALTSIKMESTGPFTGSFEDVLERMGDPYPPGSCPEFFTPR